MFDYTVMSNDELIRRLEYSTSLLRKPNIYGQMVKAIAEDNMKVLEELQKRGVNY